VQRGTNTADELATPMESNIVARGCESTRSLRTWWRGQDRRPLLRLISSSAKRRKAKPIQSRKRDHGFNKSEGLFCVL
jgi:hypothetical protein